MRKPLTFSAAFKRDYVAMSAVIIFLAIVAVEIVLAVSIPLYLERDDAMVLQEQRLTLLSSFDNLRSQISNINPVNANAELEKSLVAWEIDKLAIYLRQESDHLTGEEIRQLQQLVADTAAIVGTLRRKKSFSAENRLDTGKYVERVLNEVKAK